ncbi:MAG TPA: CHAT domain-containing protein, partial [Kofleriaceae bacterium]|nr:CHAT domain-containing protein [Kofleriaceae bacterium]
PADAATLRGGLATPAGVLAALTGATYAELHVHGQADLAAADASFLALSPGADQRWALTAGEVRKAKLTARPVIVLAACRAARVAPYEHRRWSLPDAFLEAGARAVIAPTVEIPDDQAVTFFAELRQRLARGEAPATALAAVRTAYVERGAAWAGNVILFE